MTHTSRTGSVAAPRRAARRGRPRSPTALRAEALESRRLLATISGQVFHDADGDGTAARTEEALRNWTVFVDANNNSVADRGEATAQTGFLGAYSFDVPAGTHVVRLALPDGWFLTSPGAGSHVVTLRTPLSSSSDKDFGAARPASLSGFAFEDWDSNGAWDPADPGFPPFRPARPAEPRLADWLVYLDFNGNNVPDKFVEPTASTDASGNYAFGGLRPGTYTVRQVLQAGWVQYAPPAGEHVVTVSSGQAAPDLDFANARPASISGQKFHDLDGDSYQDEGEPALSGWTIYIDANHDAQFDPLTDSRFAVTDASGNYSFAGLRGYGGSDGGLWGGGTGDNPYVLREVPQSGWIQTRPSSAGVLDPHPGAFTVHLRSGDAAVRDFGNTRPASVSGAVFHDLDADRARGLTEPGLAGRTVFIDHNSNGQPETTEPSAVTDAAGSYTITGIFPGPNRAIRQVVPDGWVQTAPPDNPPSTLPGAHEVQLTSGQAVTGLTFGTLRPSSVAGTQYEDRNRNGARDTGEPAVPGWTVHLDRNDNGIVDVIGAASAGSFYDFLVGGATESGSAYVRGADGSVGDVNVTLNIRVADARNLAVWLVAPWGTEVPLFDRPNLPAGASNFTDTTLDDEAPTNIAAATSAPFTGAFHPQGGPTTLAAFDGGAPNGQWQLKVRNYDTTRFASVDNWSLALTLTESMQRTNAAGAYTFGGLPAGRYTVREISRAGWDQTAPAGNAGHTVTLVEGQNVTGLDFGNYHQPSTVAGRHVFYNNSVFDGRSHLADAADDAAIATDKSALPPGQPATFSNLTSYTRGINGLMVDLSNLWGRPTIADFQFQAGNSADPSTWANAPFPEVITLRPLADAGRTRLTLTWPDGAIRNQWLRVSVKATAVTGLAANDVFYFGNLTGETGDVATPTAVTAHDLMRTRANVASSPASVTSRHDFDRDGRVNAADLWAVRAAQSRVLPAPAPPAAAPRVAFPVDSPSRRRPPTRTVLDVAAAIPG